MATLDEQDIQKIAQAVIRVSSRMQGPGVSTGNAGKITREFIDSLLLEPRYLDAVMPSTEFSLFGKIFSTPIMTGALSHLNDTWPDGMVEYSRGAALANAVAWVGMGSKEELERITATGASVIKIVKPHRDNQVAMDRISHARDCGVLAVGMDLDHAFNRKGEFDSFEGLDFGPKSTKELRMFVEHAGIPFVVKGVLSVTDAVKCKQAGVAGIVLSHHNGRLDYAVPPMMVLPEIRKAVGDEMKIFVDCSLETGVDAFKAIALGADACSYGRYLKKHLAQGGAHAVAEEIQQLTRQLIHAMGMTACENLAHINSSIIHRRTF